MQLPTYYLYNIAKTVADRHNHKHIYMLSQIMIYLLYAIHLRLDGLCELNPCYEVYYYVTLDCKHSITSNLDLGISRYPWRFSSLMLSLFTSSMCVRNYKFLTAHVDSLGQVVPV